MVDYADTTAPTARRGARDHLARAAKLAPLARYVPKHPAFLIGAAVVGLVGALAWRNREKIADRARPLLQEAADKTRPLLQEAAQRGAALRERLPIRRSDTTAT